MFVSIAEFNVHDSSTISESAVIRRMSISLEEPSSFPDIFEDFFLIGDT